MHHQNNEHIHQDHFVRLIASSHQIVWRSNSVASHQTVQGNVAVALNRKYIGVSDCAASGERTGGPVALGETVNRYDYWGFTGVPGTLV